jgi:hypothetical protein
MKLMSVNKILSKYIHVESCFDAFIIKNIMMQLEFNLDTRFNKVVFSFPWNAKYKMSTILE